MRERQTQPTIGRQATAYEDEFASARDRTLLGRYRVLESRASGGFGTVEVCWDTRLQRRVAIKCMPMVAADDYGAQTSTVGEALAEARTSSMLSHPNIVTVYDFEWDGEYAYLIMEFVDGVTLAELLARVEDGVLTPDECAHLLQGIASALSYAHENGVLHLDIKPANIMIDRSGTPKLGDFGMATLASAAGYGDARGGTVGYMPPEQIFGELVDERSDLFSLAACTLQALTGDAPFVAASADRSADLIEKNVGDDDIARVRLDCGLAAGDALQAALEAEPSMRTASVSAFARALVPALGDPAAGLASLRDLLEQLTRDDVAPATADGVPLSVPERAPWLPGLVGRASVAAVCAWGATIATPSLGLGGGAVAALPALIAAVCGALLPQLGSALTLAALVAAIGLGTGGPTVTPFASVGAVAIVGVALGAWWALVGRRERLSGLAVLLPTCVLSPAAAVAPAAYALGPIDAGATALVGAALATVISGCGEVISSGGAWTALVAACSTPATLVGIGGIGIAAALGSAVSRIGNGSHGIVGQMVALAGTVAALSLKAGVENGGIWGTPPLGALVVALLLSLLMCIATALFGRPDARRETV